MSRSLTLPSVALALCLGACASQPVAPAAAVAPTANAPAAITADADASPYGLFLAGRAARDEGRMVAASDFLSRAATLEGEPAYLQVKAFSAALLAGDIPQAAALAPQASADDDDQAIANQRLGVLVQGVEAMAEDHNKQAYALLTGPGVGYPHRSAAVLVAAWAAAAAGDGVSATAHADLGADVVAQFVGELDRAQLLDRFGKPDLAEAAYRQLLANGDGGGLISAAYGAFLERRGRSKDAEDIYRAALAQTPEETTFADAAARAARHGRAPPRTPIRQGAAEALIVCAAGLMAQKQEEVALDYLRLALRLDPDNDEAWVLVGDLLSSSGDEEGARDAYAHPKPGSPRFVSAQGKLAWSYANDGEGDTAVEVARAAVKAAPGNRRAITTLAGLLSDNADYDEAAAVIGQLIDQPGAAPDWRLYYLRAAAYDGAGDWTKEEADLQAALRLQPDNPDLLNYLGYSWIDRGEHLQEALAMVQKAVAAEPQSGGIIDSLGWGYYRLGDYASAVARLEQAVMLEPADADVNDHLGDAYWRVGRKIEAQFQWRRVLTLDPDDAQKAAVEAKLASPLGVDAPIPPTPPTPATPPAAAPAANP